MALFSLERPRGAKKVSWFTILGIVLVPFAIGGLLTWALWNPTERLDTITAAVVNEDTPVELDGQTVPLGRQLAAGLVTGGTEASAEASATPTPTVTPGAGTSATPAPNVSGSDSSGNFSWVLTDSDDAAAGLADGTYATVVTIPSDFSAAATSYAGDAADAVKATIDIATSEKSKLVDDAISATVTSTATALLNDQLTTAYLENVYVGFNTLNSRLGDAADGADELADGAGQLSSGATALADGTGSLAAGVAELATGASGLSDGVGQVASGASDLADGVGRLAGGAAQSQQGATDLATGADGLATGLDGLSTGIATLGGTAQTLADAAAASTTATGTTLGTIEALAQQCAGTDPVCDAILAEARSQLDATSPTSAVVQSGTVQAYAEGLDAGINDGTDGGPSLVEGAASSAAGAGQLSDGASALASGLGTLAAGATASADGAAQLSSGATAASDGAAELAAGADAAASGADELAAGATGVSDGAGGIATGTQSLADGLGSAVEEIPTYSDAEAENLAGVASAPVESTAASDDLFGSSSVPFFTVVALWLGALATFLVLGAGSARAFSSTRSSASLGLRSAVPTMLIGVGQGLAVAIVMQFVADLAFFTWVSYALLAMLAGAVFAAVNQGLVGLLGGLGRFVSMLAAVIVLAAGIISTVPALFDSVVAVLPLSPALTAMQGVVNGTGGIGGGILALVLWGCLGLVLTVLAIARTRVVSVRELGAPVAA